LKQFVRYPWWQASSAGGASTGLAIGRFDPHWQINFTFY
jgi:hypothetical protein